MNTTRQCYFCTNNMDHIDYKDVETLGKFVDDHARIQKSRKTSVCSKHQRKLAKAVKNARFMALMPFMAP